MFSFVAWICCSEVPLDESDSRWLLRPDLITVWIYGRVYWAAGNRTCDMTLQLHSNPRGNVGSHEREFSAAARFIDELVLRLKRAGGCEATGGSEHTHVFIDVVCSLFLTPKCLLQFYAYLTAMMSRLHPQIPS